MNRITRVKSKDYTTISNLFMRDKNISLKAKGLLATILSLPEDWDFSISGICAIVKEGKTAVYSAIDELKEYKYCTVEVSRDENGRITGNDYTFIENPYAENLNMDNQPQLNKDLTNSIPNTDITIDKEINKKEYKEKFEECWIAYRRKGSKKKSLDCWNKLKESEMDMVMPHIKAYVSSRDIQFQKDFERYLRDKVFLEVVYSGNNIVYDPTKNSGETESYMPTCGGALMYNDYYKCFMYTGYWDGHIADGYTDENRPDGAKITLNNGRGVITWSRESKEWRKHHE